MFSSCQDYNMHPMDWQRITETLNLHVYSLFETDDLNWQYFWTAHCLSLIIQYTLAKIITCIQWIGKGSHCLSLIIAQTISDRLSNLTIELYSIHIIILRTNICGCPVERRRMVNHQIELHADNFKFL
jgi:hypothetical protein